MKLQQQVRIKILILSLCIFTFVSCVENDNPLPSPQRDPQKSRLLRSTPISHTSLRKLEGVYTVEQGKNSFGDHVIVKQIGDRIAIFCVKDTYFVFETGVVDSLAIFEGYWRFDLGTQQGYSTLEISSKFDSQKLDSNFVIKGRYNAAQPLQLRFSHALKDTTNSFLIFDHHGGYNGAGLPYSENSLNSIRYAQFEGANGIEIDVRLTADNIPILFHDADLTTNIINGEFAIGPITNYTLAQLRALCTLKDGSPIPTLQEALDVIFNETGYQVVWLDIKDAGTVQYVLPIEISFLNKVKAAGKNITAWAGLSTSDHVTAYLADSLHSQAPSLCELNPSDVENANCAAWGPRWTLGDLTTEAKPLRAEGRKVVYWTLDKPEFINPFLTHGGLDGLLTDHPGTVAYYYYIRN